MLVIQPNETNERNYFAKTFPQLNLQRNEDGTFWNQETELCFSFWLAAMKHKAEQTAEYHFSRTYGWCLTSSDGREVVDDLETEDEVKAWAVANGYRPIPMEEF